MIHGDINAKMGVLLQLMPPGGSMEKGKGYDNTLGGAVGGLSQYLM